MLVRCYCDECKHNGSDGFCDEDVIIISMNRELPPRFVPRCTDYEENEDYEEE